MNYLKTLQKDLIGDLGLGDLPKENQEKIVSQIGELIQQRVVAHLYDEMTQNKKDEFEEFSKKNKEDSAKMIGFLMENTKDTDKVMKSEIDAVKKEMFEVFSSKNKEN